MQSKIDIISKPLEVDMTIERKQIKIKKRYTYNSLANIRHSQKITKNLSNFSEKKYIKNHRLIHKNNLINSI